MEDPAELTATLQLICTLQKRACVNVVSLAQTAEIILRKNSHCSATEMVLEPLLRERVRFLMDSSLSGLRCGPSWSPLSPGCCDLFHMQSFGVFEGRPKDDLKNAANACGQSCRDFTPPGGETPSEVSHTKMRKTER